MARRRTERTGDVTLKISRPPYERLRQVIDGTGFRTVTDLCVHALRDPVSSGSPSSPAGEDGPTGEEAAAVAGGSGRSGTSRTSV